MTREEREMDLWTNVYTGYAAINGSVAQTEADHALKAFREAFPENPPSQCTTPGLPGCVCSRPGCAANRQWQKGDQV